MTKEQQIRQYAEQLNKVAFKLVTLLNDIDIEVQERRNLIHIMAPKRKKPREGHIRERSDGRFEGRYMQNGKPRSVYARTYNDCLKKLEAALELRDNRPADIALLAWLTEYIDVYKKGEVGAETYKAMQRNIRLHIAPQASDALKLADVRPIDLQRILKSVEPDRVREDVYNILSGAFRQAVAERLVTYNPMLAVKRVKAKREKGIALTVEEQSVFLETIRGSKLELYYRFVLCSGCRRNEALDVRRDDIDEDKQFVHIRGTKTEGSDRFIPLFAGIRVCCRYCRVPDRFSISSPTMCPSSSRSIAPIMFCMISVIHLQRVRSKPACRSRWCKCGSGIASFPLLRIYTAT